MQPVLKFDKGGSVRDGTLKATKRKKRKVPLQRRFTWCAFLTGKRCEYIAGIARCQ